MAILKNTTINDTGSIILPIGEEGQRPSVLADGQMRFNNSTGKVEFYNSAASKWLDTPASGVIATGGDSVYDINVQGTVYRVHVFVTPGTSSLAVSHGGEVEYLIVAGGGATTGHNAGGAGAGGLITGTLTITPQSYSIVVGAGGQPVNGGTPNNGDNSSALGLTALGGGHGGTWINLQGSTGGSGAGGNAYSDASQPAYTNGKAATQPGSPSGGFGNAGGNGFTNVGDRSGGGGGGAGGPGGNAASVTPGVGGVGLQMNITGIPTFYAGGGGGAYRSGTAIAPGGLGGGGRGESRDDTKTVLSDGVENTGGGAGANETGTNPGLGKPGGDGIVVIRYPLRQANPDTAGNTKEDGLRLDLDFSKSTTYTGSGPRIGDSNVNDVTGNIVGSPVFTNIRTHRSSFKFNGAGDYIDLGRSYRLNYSGGTLIGWCNVEDFATATDVPSRVFVRNTSQYSSQIAFYNGGFGYETLTNSDPIDIASRQAPNHAASDITAGNWFCFALVFEGGRNAKGYVNGVQVYSDTTIDNSMDFRYLGINAGPANYPDYFKGEMAIVKLYERNLTATEISNFFEATRWRFRV